MRNDTIARALGTTMVEARSTEGASSPITLTAGFDQSREATVPEPSSGRSGDSPAMAR